MILLAQLANKLYKAAVDDVTEGPMPTQGNSASIKIEEVERRRD